MATKLLTTKQIADRLRVTPRAVRALAARYGIGTLVTDRMRVFTEADYAALARHSDGTKGRPKQAKP